MNTDRRRLLGWPLCGLAALAPFRAPLADESLRASFEEVIRNALGSPRLAGEAQLRFLGLRVYDARLWVGRGFDAERWGEHPLALELIYRRAFTAAAIARRSVEEITRQRPLPAEQFARWQTALSQWLPDVQPGDRLIGFHQPGEGMALWRSGHPQRVIKDTDLSTLFFGIWLSRQTSEPGMREALLQRLTVAPA